MPRRHRAHSLPFPLGRIAEQLGIGGAGGVGGVGLVGVHEEEETAIAMGSEVHGCVFKGGSTTVFSGQAPLVEAVEAEPEPQGAGQQGVLGVRGGVEAGLAQALGQQRDGCRRMKAPRLGAGLGVETRKQAHVRDVGPAVGRCHVDEAGPSLDQLRVDARGSRARIAEAREVIGPQRVQRNQHDVDVGLGRPVRGEDPRHRPDGAPHGSAGRAHSRKHEATGPTGGGKRNRHVAPPAGVSGRDHLLEDRPR